MTRPASASVAPGLRTAVFGASGGLGAAFVRRLAADPEVARIYAGSRGEGPKADGRVVPFRFDLTDEGSIAAAAEQVAAEGPLHLALVATGVLHEAGLQPEKTWRALSAEALSRAFTVNAVGPALIAKHWLPLLARGEKSAFAVLSARVGSIEDNRLGGWHAYRASKAALHQLIRTLAIELAVKNPTALCVSLHPGTVATPLSEPFRGRTTDLLSPDESADRLLAVLDELGPADSGRVFAWDGSPIPF